MKFEIPRDLSSHLGKYPIEEDREFIEAQLLATKDKEQQLRYRGYAVVNDSANHLDDDYWQARKEVQAHYQQYKPEKQSVLKKFFSKFQRKSK